MTTSPRGSDIVELYNEMSYDEYKDVLPLAKKWLVGKDPLKCFHSGKLELISESGKYKTQPVNDLCTDDYLLSLIVPSTEDIKTVLQSSLQGQQRWNNLDQHKKGHLLSELAKTLEEQRELLSEIEAATFGSVLSNVKNTGVLQAAKYFQYYSGWAHVPKKQVKTDENGVVMVCLMKPAPLTALATLIAPALAAGQVVVVNPPLEAPLLSFLFAELCSQCGLPPGVVNVLPGPLGGAKIVVREFVHEIAIWGTRQSCKDVCSDLTKIHGPIIPFYYGKAISIIFDSSDQSSAIEVLVKNLAFSYQQNPWSVRTILVEESAFPTFAEALKAKLNKCKVGSSCEHGVDIGLPKKCDIDTTNYLNAILNHFMQRGTEVFQIPVADSLFFPPTIVVGTDAETNCIVKEYDILPFISVLPFRRPKEAIEMANKSQFGVAVSVWTSCLSLALHMASNLDAGTVWINDHGLLEPSIPFSNRKHGFGCIGSQNGLQQFLSVQLDLDACEQQIESKQEVTKTQENKEYLAHFGGAFKKTANEEHITVLSCSGCLFSVSECDRNDMKRAVEAAQTAQQKWWKLGSGVRAAILLSVADQFQEKAKSFLKLFKNSKNDTELDRIVNILYYWGTKCNNLVSFNSDCPVTNSLVHFLHNPLGVIGIIVDDYSELEAFVLSVVSAISFGNSVVVLPNSKNPVPALEFCAFLTNLKIPVGLVNVLPGSKCNLYSELVFHKDVQAVWYTGEDKNTMVSLFCMANKVMKFLWKCPSKTDVGDASEFEYAASHPKAIWLPSEDTSC